MPSNREWCRPLGGWRDYLTHLITRVDPEDLRRLTILLDFRPIYGNADLARALWSSVFTTFGQVASGLHYLAADAKLQMWAPFNLFGGIVTKKAGPHRHEINLKSAACVHIVNRPHFGR